MRTDVWLHAGSPTRFARARAEVATTQNLQGWFSYRRLADGASYLRWSGLCEFLVSPDGRRILYHRQKRAPVESFSVYLLGQVLSFSLLAFDSESLHGTVAVVNGGAIGFLGNCGYGKSTLGAALLARGFPILTDDLVALEQGEAGWRVHPGIPRIKLFPSVARRLLGSDQRRVPMNHRTSKLVLQLEDRQAVRRPVPLKALYVLSDPAQQGSHRSTRPRIEPLSGHQAFIEVIRAAFNLVVLEKTRLAKQFAFATRLVAGVSVRRLTYARDLSLLPAVCDAVLADLVNVSGTATAQENGKFTT
jgi:hypothetical protein